MLDGRSLSEKHYFRDFSDHHRRFALNPCPRGLLVLDRQWYGQSYMRHVVQFRIRFGDCDPAQIAYYPRYFEWFHDAFEAMFEPITGMDYAQLIKTHGIGYPAVQVACDYRAPSRWGELVDLEIFLSRLSERSATFEYRVRRDGTLLASASVKIATMDLKTHRSAPMPPSVYEALQPYLETENLELPDTSRIR